MAQDLTSMHCLIFDLDGTLVDSEPLSSQAILDLLPDLDDTVAGLMHRYRGHRMATVLSDIATRLGRALEPDFESRYRERISSLYDSLLTSMPGVTDALSSLPHPKCVASNSPVTRMHHGLRAAGLATFFGDNLFSAYDVGRWKPDPHLFLHAAERMGFPPERCVVLEDSEAGLAAGRAAGMKVIHFRPDGAARSESHTGHVIAHFDELAEALEALA